VNGRLHQHFLHHTPNFKTRVVPLVEEEHCQ